MRIIKGRLLDQTCDALVLPVTGYIDSDRCAVFCEEPSLEAATKWKPLSVALGERISRMGSCTQIITTLTSNGGAAMSGIRTDEHIIAFPTRPGRIYHEVDGWDEVLPEFRNHPPLTLSTPGWMCKSNLRIIQFSTEELVVMRCWGKGESK